MKLALPSLTHSLNFQGQFCKRLLGSALLLLGGIVAPATAQEGEFQERMTRWQGGGIANDSGYQQAAPTRQARSSPVRQASASMPLYDEEMPIQQASYEQGAYPPAGYRQAGAFSYANDAPPGEYYGGNYFGGSDLCCDSCQVNDLWWFRKEMLVWWHKGRNMPSLVTMDSNTNVNQNDGRLPGAPVLFGGEQPGDATLGFRLDFGTWIDPCHTVGIGGKFFLLGDENLDYNASFAQLQTNQLIAIPFTRSPNTADAFIVASNGGPQTINGSVNIHADTEVFGAEAYATLLLREDCISRVDFLTGYQFGRINEGIDITTTQTAPTSFTLTDRYRTYNEFHGGIIGLRLESQWSPCLTFSGYGKLGIGGMQQRAVLSGTDTRSTTAGGLLVERADAGSFTRNVFATSPELNLTLNRHINRCMDFTVGYNLLYYTNVARAEQQIDTVVGSTAAPLVIRDSSMWLQGINIGLVVRR